MDRTDQKCRYGAAVRTTHTPGVASGTGRERVPGGRKLGAALLASAVLIALGAAAANAQVSLRVDNVLRIRATQFNTQNCQGLRDTLAALDSPSYQNRYLILLEPGEYYCGAQPLLVPTGVTIEGAGVDQTFIVGSVEDTFLGAVHLSGNNTLRSVSVYNTMTMATGNTIAVSVFAFLGGASARLEDVYLISNGGGLGEYAILTRDANVVVRDSTIHSAVAATENSTLVISFSELTAGYYEDGSTSSSVVCRFVHWAATVLDPSCDPP